MTTNSWNFWNSWKWCQIFGIFEILGNDVKFLEFLKFLEMMSNTWNFRNSWKWNYSKMSIFLESYIFFKIFLCLQTKVCLFTFSMFIYQNFQKFRSPVSKFSFVYKQRFVYLHFQCLFTFFYCLFWKNSWKWRQILGIFGKIRIFIKFFVPAFIPNFFHTYLL